MSTLDQSQVAGSTLGYAQITANITTTSTTVVQATGLTVTVTIPSGGRRVRITGLASNVGSSGTVQMSIWDGTVGTGTSLAQFNSPNALAPGVNIQAITTPA